MTRLKRLNDAKEADDREKYSKLGHAVGWTTTPTPTVRSGLQYIPEGGGLFESLGAEFPPPWNFISNP